MRISVLALALAGLLAACANMGASMVQPDYQTGHFGAGMTADRLPKR